MTDILKEYPTPWKVLPERHIETTNGEKIVFGLDLRLLKFITETINNSVRPRVSDILCKCKCGWEGTVCDCEDDVDGEGNLGCPHCLKIVEVYA